MPTFRKVPAAHGATCNRARTPKLRDARSTSADQPDQLYLRRTGIWTHTETDLSKPILFE